MNITFNDTICVEDYLNCLEMGHLSSSEAQQIHYEETSINELLDDEGIPLVYSLSRHPGWAKGIDSAARLLLEMRMWLMGSYNFKSNFNLGDAVLSASPIISYEGRIISIEGLSAFYLACALGLESVPIAFIKPINKLH